LVPVRWVADGVRDSKMEAGGKRLRGRKVNSVGSGAQTEWHGNRGEQKREKTGEQFEIRGERRCRYQRVWGRGLYYEGGGGCITRMAGKSRRSEGQAPFVEMDVESRGVLLRCFVEQRKGGHFNPVQRLGGWGGGVLQKYAKQKGRELTVSRRK